MNKTIRKTILLEWLFLIFMLAAFRCVGASESEFIRLDFERGKIPIARHMVYFEDPEGQLSLKDIMQGDLNFQPINDDEINIGLSQSAFWFRFQFDIPDDNERREWFLEFAKPGLGKIDLYIPASNGGYRVKQTGADRPMTSRDAAHRTFVLSVPVDSDWQRPFYVRIRSVISINTAINLWRPDKLSYPTSRDYMCFGIIYGIMIAMIIYNLAIFAFLNDRTYLYYVIYMCFMLMHLSMLYGHLPMYVKTANEKVYFLNWIVPGVAWMAAGAFCRSFLDTRTLVPWMDKLIMVVMGTGLLIVGAGILQMTFWANIINVVLTPFGTMTAIAAGAIVWRKGFTPALYYLMAWGVLMVGAVLYSMGGIVIPRTVITRYTIAVGTPLEALILSLALAARIKALRQEKDASDQKAERFQILSQSDGLTGLYNKRYLMHRLNQEIKQYHKSGQPGSLTLIMMDIDDFKKLNDTYGHQTGDDVLRLFASILKDYARQSDYACRYGGEEFALILANTPVKNAMEVAERIRNMFSQSEIQSSQGSSFSSTVSLGLSQLQPGDHINSLIERADKALYQAKLQGKNRVVLSDADL